MKSLRPMLYIMLFTLLLGAGVTVMALGSVAVRL